MTRGISGVDVVRSTSCGVRGQEHKLFNSSSRSAFSAEEDLFSERELDNDWAELS